MIPANWKEQMQEIDAEINDLPYVSDAKLYKTEEFWTEITEKGGDCDDYAVTKLRRLHDLGWPIESLHLACCYTETDEYHAVLIVNTPEGDFMLDNRMSAPTPVGKLQDLDYKPDCIQLVGGKQDWVKWLA